MPKWRVRDQETAQLHSHRDIRSATYGKNRLRKQSQKYYGYRSAHPSWVGQRYLDWDVAWEDRADCGSKIYSTHFTEMFVAPQIYIARSQHPIEQQPIRLSTKVDGRGCVLTVRPAIWQKADMYSERESDIYPLDRRHHISKRKHVRYGQLYSLQERGRGMKQRHRSLAWEVDHNLYHEQMIYDFDQAGLHGWTWETPSLFMLDTDGSIGASEADVGQRTSTPDKLDSEDVESTMSDWVCLYEDFSDATGKEDVDYDFLSDIEI